MRAGRLGARSARSGQCGGFAPVVALAAATAMIAIVSMVTARAAEAQFMTGKRIDKERSTNEASLTNRELVENIGFDQRLGAALPLELGFVDASGRAVRLGDFFGDKPVILGLVYYRCPVLCSLVERGLVSGLKPLELAAGTDFEVVFVSIDPTDDATTASERKRSVVDDYGRPASADGWHFLTGTQPAIEELAAAVGFRYQPDPATGQFAHAAGLTVATPAGRLSRYLFGVDYEPRDLKLSLVESSDGRIGSPADQLLLICFKYDATLGKYTAATLLLVKIGATLTLVGLALFFFFSLRRDRRERRERQLAAGEVV